MAARIGGAVFSMFSETPSERIELAKICVIGAGYNKDDTDRWGQIDPNYIGLSGNDRRPDLIKDPVDRDAKDWHKTLFLNVFGPGGALADKKFDMVFIDRRTLAWMQMQTFVDLILSLIGSHTTRKLYLHSLEIQNAEMDFEMFMSIQRRLQDMGFNRNWGEEESLRSYINPKYALDRFPRLGPLEDVAVYDPFIGKNEIFKGLDMSRLAINDIKRDVETSKMEEAMSESMKSYENEEALRRALEESEREYQKMTEEQELQRAIRESNEEAELEAAMQRLLAETAPAPATSVPKQEVTAAGHAFVFECDRYRGHWEMQDDAKCGLHALRAIAWSKQLNTAERFDRFMAATKDGLLGAEGTCNMINIDSILMQLPRFGLDYRQMASKSTIRIDPSSDLGINQSQVRRNIRDPPNNLRGYIINVQKPVPHWYTIRRGHQRDCFYNLDSLQNKQQAMTSISKEEVMDRIFGSGDFVTPAAVYEVTTIIRDGRFTMPRLM